MITENEYKNALKMIAELDMEDEKFHQYLEVALDYEIARSAICANTTLKLSSISQHSVNVSRRASSPVIGIF